jgi:hypothetical protein
MHVTARAFCTVANTVAAIERTIAGRRCLSANFQRRSLAASANGCVPGIIVRRARNDRRAMQRKQVQAPQSAAMPNRVFLGARGPAAQRKPDQSIGGTRLGRRVVEPHRTLIIHRVAVGRLFWITDPTQDASDWLLEWHVVVALVVLPGDCAAAPGWCPASP